MAISLIGTPQTGNAINGGDVTLTFSTAPSTGDVVYVFGGHGIGSATIGPSTGGYTALFTNTASTVRSGVWRKVMGASPDTTVVCQGGGSSSDAVAYCCFVLRGVNQSSPEDATTVSSSILTSTNPDPSSITTITPGAWVIAISTSIVSDSTPGTITNYSNAVSANATDTNPVTTAGTTRQINTAGAEDPGAWSSWSSGVWQSITVAVKPDIANLTDKAGIYNDLPPSQNLSTKQSKTAFNWINPAAVYFPVLAPPAGATFTAIKPILPDQVAKQWIKSSLPQTPTFTLGPGGITQSDLFIPPTPPALTFFDDGRAIWDNPKGKQFWELPRDTNRTALTWIESGNVTSPFVTVMAPGIQYWTIQQPKLPPALSFIGPPTQAPVTKPFSQTDWPLPGTAKYPDSLRTFEHNQSRFDTGFMPGSISDFGIYIPPKQWFEIPQVNLSLLTAPAAQPFAQTNWPLPLGKTPAALTFIGPKTFDSGPMPINQYYWPLPVLAKYPDSLRTFEHNQARFDTGFKPGSISDFGIYIPPKVWVEIPQANMGLLTSFTGPLPLNQYNWPLPTSAKYPDSLRTFEHNQSRFDTGFMPGSIADFGVYIPPKQWFHIQQPNIQLLTAPAATKPPINYDFGLPFASKYSDRTYVFNLLPFEYIKREGFVSTPQDTDRSVPWSVPQNLVLRINPVFVDIYVPSSISDFGIYIPPKKWFEIPQANMGLLTAPPAAAPPFNKIWDLPRVPAYPASLRTYINNILPFEYIKREAFVTTPKDTDRKVPWAVPPNLALLNAPPAPDTTRIPSSVSDWGVYIPTRATVGQLPPGITQLLPPPTFPQGKKPVDWLFVPPIFRFEPQAQKNIQLLSLKPFGELRTERPYPPAYLNFRFPAQEQKNIGLLSTFPPGKNGVYPPRDTDRVAKTWINQDALQLTPPPIQPKPNGIYPVPRESMFPKTGLFWQSNFTRFGHTHVDDDDNNGRPFDRHRPRRNPMAMKMPIYSRFGRR